MTIRIGGHHGRAVPRNGAGWNGLSDGCLDLRKDEHQTPDRLADCTPAGTGSGHFDGNADVLCRGPALHPNSALIKGVVCGVRVEEIEDPVVRNVRSPGKLIDELAKGKPLEKIMR